MPKLKTSCESIGLAKPIARSSRDAAIVSRSLELPEGYQHFGWYEDRKPSLHSVVMNDVDSLRNTLRTHHNSELYFYTSHQIYYENGLIKQTRSSPNWEGGILTYCTCKHLMRCTKRSWEGVWIATVGPRNCENNCLVCVGRISMSFVSNYSISGYFRNAYPSVFKVKSANLNPRGDLYTPKKPLFKSHEWYDHHNFEEPPGHTRSVDFYKKSPGSVSERKDGLIPKWWRDHEYLMRNVHPPHFMISPAWIFSVPMVWSRYDPKRASLRLTAGEFLESLHV